MPYDFEYPIDDNTLFILLALRYQGFVELSGLDSIYDETVNYDYTLLRKSTAVLKTIDNVAIYLLTVALERVLSLILGDIFLRGIRHFSFDSLSRYSVSIMLSRALK